MRTTPRKAGRDPVPGSRFLSQVLADNIHVLRAKARMNQGELATRMGWLGQSWTRVTVSDVERARRNVTCDELFALALLLGAPIPVLLDPAGIDGQGRAPLDYGAGTPMRADIASRFVRGTVGASMPSEGTLAIEPADDTFDAAAAALDMAADIVPGITKATPTSEETS